MENNRMLNIGGEALSPLESPEFLAAMYAADGGNPAAGFPEPFNADVFLIGTEIAGTTFVENIAELYERLEEGERVLLLREPSNEYDEHAILVKTQLGEKLGYVPMRTNLILSRLMDAGKELYARIRLKEIRAGGSCRDERLILRDGKPVHDDGNPLTGNEKPYYHIVIKIYLKDSAAAPVAGREEEDKLPDRLYELF